MATEPDSRPPRPAIEAQLARILASAVFSKSERMSRFLRFIVEKAIAGTTDDLKEYTIALAVFDKDESFDPRIDPTVRSEARRLRTKLAEYYESSGPQDAVRIELPKGSYAPVFQPRHAQAAPDRRLRMWVMLAAALAAAAILGAGWWRLTRTGRRPTARSIAVLPFENLSADPANAYFTDGLTEEILNALANAPGFTVAARTSAAQFKDRHEDPRTIGARLNVAMVIEGSVRKDGDRLRITPRLVSTADGYNLWSAEYDRDWTDLFALQREIATSIVRALGGKLGHVSAQPADPETYRLYLEGRHQFAQWRPAAMMQAIRLFEQVVARDREYAPGYAGLSAAYGMLTAFGSTAIPPDESRKKAKAAALRAIELDPNSAEAWVNLAPKFVEELDWASAESAFRKALELSQNSPEAHAWYAELYLTPMGRLEEALQESQAAVALDPLSAYTVSGMGRRHYFLRQYDEAIAWFQKALDLDPHFHMAVGPLLHAHLLKGDLAGARRFLDGQKSVWPAQTLAPFQAQLAAAEGDRSAAAALSKGTGGSCQQPAIYASMGDRVQVISWLDRLIETRASCFTWIPAEPLYASWHGTPEFDALILKMKLPAPHGATTVSH